MMPSRLNGNKNDFMLALTAFSLIWESYDRILFLIWTSALTSMIIPAPSAFSFLLPRIKRDMTGLTPRRSALLPDNGRI